MSWIAVVVVCSILGYVLGYLHGDKEQRKLQLDVIQQAPVVNEQLNASALTHFRFLDVLHYGRGRYDVRFELVADELSTGERSIVSHTLQIQADGAVSLDLLFNVDRNDDDVPF